MAVLRQTEGKPWRARPAEAVPSPWEMTRRLRVLLAEDQYLVREGTRSLLESHGALELRRTALCDVSRTQSVSYGWNRCVPERLSVTVYPRSSRRRIERLDDGLSCLAEGYAGRRQSQCRAVAALVRSLCNATLRCPPGFRASRPAQGGRVGLIGKGVAWERQKVLRTSTHLVHSRIVSMRVVLCRSVFAMPNLNWRKKNRAYAPLSAHNPVLNLDTAGSRPIEGNN